MFVYRKPKYRIAVKDKKYYLQKKSSWFGPWQFIMLQTGIDTFRPIVCETWDKAVQRLKKYIADHQVLGSNIDCAAEIDHIS